LRPTPLDYAKRATTSNKFTMRVQAGNFFNMWYGYNEYKIVMLLLPAPPTPQRKAEPEGSRQCRGKARGEAAERSWALPGEAREFMRMHLLRKCVR